MDVYGYRENSGEYIITKNGDDYIRTGSELEAQQIVELLMKDGKED